MSRRSPRYRVRFAATVEIAEIEHTLICHTRDISADGCFLETTEMIAEGVAVHIAVMDNQLGVVVEAEGRVTRVIGEGKERGMGVRLASAASLEWRAMVERYELASETTKPTPVRLHILVVGDEQQRRGALALYVTSGWDVRFATDLDSAADALAGGGVDAVIAELPLSDPRWGALMRHAERAQPTARRIVRTPLGDNLPPTSGDATLVHRFVDFESGLDALVDALTAPIEAPLPA